VGTTLENLIASAGGENHEQTSMYPEFAKIAREEGLQEIACIFDAIAVAERFHEKRFLALAKNIEKGQVFKKDKSVTWRCRNCGYIYEGEAAPNKCPACAHAQAHFEVAEENW